MHDMTEQDDEPDLVITTNKEHGEAELQFRSRAEEDLRFPSAAEERLAQLHGKVVKVVDGVSTKAGVKDFVVAIRKRDFDKTVQRLERFYQNEDITVRVKQVGR